MYGHPELSSLSRAPMLSLHLLFLSYSGVQELSSLFRSHEPPAAPAGATAPIRPPPLLSYATAPSTCSVHLLCSSSSKARQRGGQRTCAGGTAAGVAQAVGVDGTTASVGEFADGTSHQIERARTGSLALVGESQPNIQRAEKRLYVLGARAGAVVSRDDGLGRFSS